MAAQDNRAMQTANRAELLDGARAAADIKRDVAAEVDRLREEHQITPCLAAILVGDDAASAVYVRNKIRACAEVGVASDQLLLTATTTTDELLSVVVALK